VVALTPLRVDVDSSPVYELLLQIGAFTGHEELNTYDVGHRWGVTQRGRCSAHVLRALDRLGGPYAFWDQLIGYQAVRRADGVASFFELLVRTDAKEVHLHMLGCYSAEMDSGARAAIRAAVEGSRRAIAPALESLAGGLPERREVMGPLLATPAEEVKDLVLDALRGWYERIFLKGEPTVSTLLEDDAAAQRMLLTTDPERLILLATGVRYDTRPDVDAVVLVPTLIMRPWLAVVNYRRMRIYCYPVSDDPGTPDSVPPGLIRMHEALADPIRLRILKALGNERLSATQLADRLAEDVNTVRAHLARLRVGRLIHLNCGATLTYERRSDLMRAVGQPLKSYLQLPVTSP
jgi:DNA-binding transcriptional ArsR family regulator